MASSSGRTLDPGVSLFTAAEIRVAVVPVGPVPRELLDEYLRLIQRFRAPTLSAVQPFLQQLQRQQQQRGTTAAGAMTSPFQLMDWGSGTLRLRFVQAEEARRRSRVAELHPHRQVVAVLGLLHCPGVAPGGLAAAHTEFASACRTGFPEARVVRCFAFEPSEGHILQDGKRDVEGLVMFPPGGQAHLEQHLEVWMHDLAALILSELERWALDPGQGLFRHGGGTGGGGSYTDSAEFAGPASVMDEMTKLRMVIGDDELREKRRRGRMHKVLGDVSLMAGSPKDALNNFKVSQELAKATNDWVWCGAAMEGSASARLLETLSSGGGDEASASAASGHPLQQQHRHTRSDSNSGPGGRQLSQPQLTFGPNSWPSWDLLRARGVEGEVREQLAEARACYKKKGGVPPMQIEQGMKLSRLLAGLHGRTARREVSELVSAALEAAASLPHLEDRLAVLVDAAQVSGMAGAARRRSLLLWHAAEVTRSAAAVGSTLSLPTEVSRAADRLEITRLRLTLRGMDPLPDDLTAMQDDVQLVYQGGTSGVAHWSARLSALQLLLSRAPSSGKLGAAAIPTSAPVWPGSALPGATTTHRRHGEAWASVRVAALEQVLQAARRAGVPWEAWEAAAGLLRLHHTSLSPQTQAAILEALAQASADLPSAARQRPGLGAPCPLAQLKRVLPPAPPLQPQWIVPPQPPPPPGGALPGGAAVRSAGSSKTAAAAASAGGGGGGGGSASSGGSPFIFNPNAGKRKELEEKQRGRRARAAGAGEAAAGPEWVCGEEGRVEVVLSNPLAVPVKVEAVSLHARYTPPPAPHTTKPPPCSSSSSFLAATAADALYPSGTAAAAAAAAAAGAAASHHHASAAAAFWQPIPIGPLVLPPGGKPVRVVLCGTPLLPGTLTLTGLRVVAMGGVQWLQPFLQPGEAGETLQRKPSAGLGKLPLELQSQPGPPVSVSLTVVPGLPLLRAVLRPAGRGGTLTGSSNNNLPLAVAPQDEELASVPSAVVAMAAAAAAAVAACAPTRSGLSFGATGSRSAGSSSGSRGLTSPLAGGVMPPGSPPPPVFSPVGSSGTGAGGAGASGNGPVTVWQGQACTWELVLTNVGSAAVGCVKQLAVANARGQLLKPLPGPRPGRMPASAAGAHLEPGAGAAAMLAAAMPLLPGASVSVPVEVHVGRPSSDVFQPVVLEIRLAYTGLLPPRDCEEPGPGDSAVPTSDALDAPPEVAPPPVAEAPLMLLGRRLVLPVQFRVQPTVQVMGLQFLDHSAPLRDGARCWPLRTWQQQQNSGPSTQASSTAMSPSTSGLPPQHQMSSAALYVPRSLGGPASAADGGDSSRRGGDASFGGLLQGGFGGGGGLGLGSMGGRVGSVGTLMLPPAKSRVWPRGALLAARRSSGMGSSGSLGQGGPPGTESDQDWADGEDVDLAAALNGGASSSSSFLIPMADGEVSAAGGDRAAVDWDSRPSLASETAVAAAAASWAAGEAMHVSLASDCVMQVAVASACERYLRVWIEWTPAAAAAVTPASGRLGDSGSGAGSSSEVVLPPGEAAPLRCHLIPETATATSGRDFAPAGDDGSHVDGKCSGGAAGAASSVVASAPAAAALPLPEEPDRLAAAEAVCGSWAVAWRMIGLEDETPHGSVQLSAVDVARMLSPVAISNLQPSQLGFSLAAVYRNARPPLEDAASPTAAAALAVACRPRVQDLTRRVQDMGLRLAGEVWGLRLAVGEVLELEVQVVNRSLATQLVQFSVGAANLASGLPPGAAGFGASDLSPGLACGSKGGQHLQGAATTTRAFLDLSGGPPRSPSSGNQQQPRFTAGGIDLGVVLLGQLEHIRCRLAPSTKQQQQGLPASAAAVHTQCMAVLFSNPGLYQLYVYDVLAAPEAPGWQQDGNSAAGDWVAARGRPVYANVQRLIVLVG